MSVDGLIDYDEDKIFDWDLEIAERIMGWKVITDEDDNCIISVYDEVNDTSYYMPTAPREDREWSPTQDVEQAFQALDKVNCAWQIQSSEKGYRVCLQVHNPDLRPSVRQMQMEEETLANAICQAVLMIPDSYLILREEG